jgi:hypothetical protein
MENRRAVCSLQGGSNLCKALSYDSDVENIINIEDSYLDNYMGGISFAENNLTK